MRSWAGTRYAFVFRTTFFALLLRREHFRCHAFLPTSASSRAFKYTNGQPKMALRNSVNKDNSNGFHDDARGEESIQAIPNGRGEFSSFGSSRGGDDADNGKFANYLSALSPYNALRSVKEGFERRISADPEFFTKSVFEVIIAGCTQYVAEVGRRGRSAMLPEVDFVVAGVLTAVFGKYYAMWTVAPTRESAADESSGRGSGGENAPGDANWRERVPTNAFQPTLLDGRTTPTPSSRLLAFVLPMPQLFRAGVIASTIGYGLTSLLIRLRTALVPHYAVPTKPISVPLAAIYTGFFMAFVSNIRYQLLAGIVEPSIDGVFLRMEAIGDGKGDRKKKYLRQLKMLVIISVRWGNGILGSWIAIGGMKACGLQQLKE